MTHHHKPLILIIDDEQAILSTLKEALEDEGFIVETLAHGDNVLATVGNLVPDLILLDIFIPKFNGLDLLATIKKEYPQQQVIMISGFGTIPIAIEALKKGALDFIEKPLNLDDILAKLSFLNQCPQQSSHQHEHSIQANKLAAAGIVGASALFSELIHHATLIAPFNLPVLIYGPSGSGKSLFAQYLHSVSKQASCAYTTINCSAIEHLPEDIKGHTGSLFLKNIHLLNHNAQKQLLGLIETATTQRIITSTSENLFAMAQKGLFCKALFAKLNAIPLEIPSINKRRYDIPLLVDHFVTQANKEHKRSITFSSALVRFLRNYYWTGDVAHIKACIQTIVQTASQTKNHIDIQHVMPLLPEQPSHFVEEQTFARFASLNHATNNFQRHYLFHLLKTHRYDTTQVAEYLNMPLALLHTKMIELHMNVRS